MWRTDVYLIAPDWSWSFVQTHEDMLGAYPLRAVLSDTDESNERPSRMTSDSILRGEKPRE